MKFLNVLLAIFGMMLLCASNGFATKYEYSDAPTPYGTASHETDTWQKLGTAWDNEYSPKQPDLDLSDDGVRWSVDNGATWGHEDVYAGQEVLIEVSMWSAGFGNHDYDQVKVWADLNQDQVWADQTVTEYVGAAKGFTWDGGPDADGDMYIDAGWGLGADNELIMAKQFFKPASMIVDDTAWNFDSADYANNFAVNTYLVYLAIPDDMYGDLWLRARASCWHTPFDETTPYGNLWQGEVEDWKLTVQPVPEPASMLLLGTGLIGLAGFRKKMGKKAL